MVLFKFHRLFLPRFIQPVVIFNRSQIIFPFPQSSSSSSFLCNFSCPFNRLQIILLPSSPFSLCGHKSYFFLLPQSTFVVLFIDHKSSPFFLNRSLRSCSQATSNLLPSSSFSLSGPFTGNCGSNLEKFLMAKYWSMKYAIFWRSLLMAEYCCVNWNMKNFNNGMDLQL